MTNLGADISPATMVTNSDSPISRVMCDRQKLLPKSLSALRVIGEYNETLQYTVFAKWELQQCFEEFNFLLLFCMQTCRYF